MLRPVQKWARFCLSEMEDSGSISLFFSVLTECFTLLALRKAMYQNVLASANPPDCRTKQWTLNEPLTSCSPGTPDSLKSPQTLTRPSAPTSVFCHAKQPCVTEARLCHWNWAQFHLHFRLLVPLELDATMYHVIDFVTSEDIEYAYFPYYPKQSMNLMRSPSHYS